MMKLDMNRKYIIVEIIPTGISPDKGVVAQISALKLKGLELLDRFDARLNLDMINNSQILDMIDYDHDSFEYFSDSKIIMDKFSKWTDGEDLLILDNTYTNNFLECLDNKRESIASYYDLEYSDDLIDKIRDKYNLEDSNYIVDLLYEGLIGASNDK